MFIRVCPFKSTISQNVFSNSLVDHLSVVASLDATYIVNMGATDLRKFVPASELLTVTELLIDPSLGHSCRPEHMHSSGSLVRGVEEHQAGKGPKASLLTTDDAKMEEGKSRA